MAAPPHASADNPQGDAEKLILEGIKLREQGKDEAALLLFEQAHSLSPTARSMAQRALAEHALGRWIQAEQHLQAALDVPGDAWIAENRAELTRALAVIGQHLGTLQIHANQNGAQVRIDGRLVGQLPQTAPYRVVVGVPLLEITLDGFYPVRRQITVRAGSVSSETIELVPVVAPSQPDPVPVRPVDPPASPAAAPAGSTRGSSTSEPSDGLSPIVFWTGAGVTAVLGGLTIWSGLDTESQNDAYVKDASAPGATREAAKRAYDDAHAAQTRTNVLLAGTAVAAIATIVIGAVFTDFGDEESALRFVPQVHAARDGGMIALHRHF